MNNFTKLRLLTLFSLMALFTSNVWGAITSPWSSTMPSGWSASGGKITLSGIEWTYGSANYLAQNGTAVQIGSSKNPQTSGWTISTPISNFGTGVTVTSITINTKTGSKGAGTYDISVNGSSVKSGDLSTTDTDNTISGLSATAGDIAITIVGAAKAAYLNSISVTFTAKSLTSLAVSGTPTKTTYQDGEAFNPEGLVVTGTYEDASTADVTSSVTGWTFDPATLSAGTTSCNVVASVGTVNSPAYNVTGLTVTAAKTLQSIAVSGTYQTEFWKGGTFNHTGAVVTAIWDDASETDVTSEAVFSTPDMTTAGEKAVTISYNTKETSYNINVQTIANTAETAYTTAQAIALIDAGNDLATEVYVKGTVSKVELFNETYKSITYCLDDDAFKIYGGLAKEGEEFSSKDDIAVNAQVVVKGIIKKYYTTYEMDKDNHLVSYTAGSKTNPTLTATWNNSLTVGGANDVYAVTYDGDGTLSVISSDPEVATAVLNGTTVTVTPVAAGTTIIEISAPETENYYSVSKSYTLTVSEPVQPTYLPFFFNGKVADVADTEGMSQTGLDEDYKTDRTKLKFNTTDDNLIISFSSAPTSLVFAIKGNPGSGTTWTGTFDVMTSADGSAYTTLKSFASLGGEEIVGLPLSSDVRFVKFEFTNKDNGNVGLGYITVSNMNPATMVIDPANKWATFSTDFQVDIPANVYAYGISVEDDKAVRTKFGGDEAFAIGGKGAVLLYTDEEEGYTKTYYDGMSIINDPVDTYEGGNLLQPVFEPIAAGEFPTFAGYTKYILQNGAKGIGFYQVTSTNTLAANRAYLIVPDGTDVKSIFDITTRINEISEASVKAEGMYNMAGQKVGADYKGIVIVNGKKMLNK